MDFSGVVEALGANVEQFAPGDDVLGTADTACGAFAEFVSVPASHLVKKPKNVSWEQAAAVPTSGMTALQVRSCVCVCVRARVRVRARARVCTRAGAGGLLSKAAGALNYYT